MQGTLGGLEGYLSMFGRIESDLGPGAQAMSLQTLCYAYAMFKALLQTLCYAYAMFKDLHGTQ